MLSFVAKGDTVAVNVTACPTTEGLTLEVMVVVVQWSDASFIEDQDHWWQAGLHREVIVYSRKGCHLCEIVKEKLTKLERRGGFRWREVDVDTDELLRRRGEMLALPMDDPERAEEDLSELSDKIRRILEDEARRHGIDA